MWGPLLEVATFKFDVLSAVYLTYLLERELVQRCTVCQLLCSLSCFAIWLTNREPSLNCLRQSIRQCECVNLSSDVTLAHSTDTGLVLRVMYIPTSTFQQTSYTLQYLWLTCLQFKLTLEISRKRKFPQNVRYLQQATASELYLGKLTRDRTHSRSSRPMSLSQVSTNDVGSC